MTTEKLIKIQKDLKAPKNQYNSFGKYNYRSAEDILEAVKPLLIKEDLLMTISDEVVLIGSKNYVKASVQIIGKDFNHSVSAFARESETRKGMDDSQITGATASYARKYALNGMFCIDDTKDADSMDKIAPKIESKIEAKKEYPKDDKNWINDKQVNEACERIAKGEHDLIDKLKETFKISKANFAKLVDAKNADNQDIFPDEQEESPF